MTNKAHILPEMTWPEAKEALAQAKLALLPVGSFEQHGPHGTFEVDAARAVGFGKLLAARMYPQAVLSPVVKAYHIIT
jgi:creatinine amidohydrolase